MTDKLEQFAPLARALLAVIFILAGYQKITGYAGTQGYMEAMGVPGGLLPLVIAVELGGGLALLAGFQARIAAFLLAGFTVIAGVLFHMVPSFGMDAMAAQGEMISFLKNLAIAGGLGFVTIFGPGRWSIDTRGKGVTAPAQ